ncbi:MAG: 50S ribosomal protein L11 methyltransferase [Saprospiraceae bacterium]|nr:50S ribosomal protein L11 methyltransferase [Pyrinomonadaceae bacterium]
MKDNKKSWVALDITAVEQAAEAVEYAFNILGSLGSEINHLRKNIGDEVVVTGYFNATPTEELVRIELSESLRIYGLSGESIRKIKNRKIEDTDWLAEWKKHWKPTEIGKFVIAPPWEVFDENGKIVIRIEPNMAFGTGTHETTQLCVKAIEANFKSGQTFLDVGTGTGILAIAAAKFQPEESDTPVNSILGCDTDTDSVAIAKDNAKLNGVSDRINFHIGSINDNTPRFDFVCANLTIDVILPILPLLLEKAGTTLVLSGILLEQQEKITSALHNSDIRNYRVEAMGEWISVTIEPSIK